ncbi:MAG: hypothetical protein H7A21_07900 [Spirochaetales bacterium]|nr:hypothetical protein [Leptospiraceae bacterium]MCP5481338.1 hypothetical protein [Spirochaetales bacterium]MCP5485776.1 hypothetical protein [Spirochaetales bacterium]
MYRTISSAFALIWLGVIVPACSTEEDRRPQTEHIDQHWLCEQTRDLEFERTVPGSLTEYRPRVHIADAATVQEFCGVLGAAPERYGDAPPRSRPWGWMAFYNAAGQVTANVVIQEREEPGYILIPERAARRLTASETSSIVRLIQDYDP